jgi:hypothetical protein
MNRVPVCARHGRYIPLRKLTPPGCTFSGIRKQDPGDQSPDMTENPALC